MCTLLFKFFTLSLIPGILAFSFSLPANDLLPPVSPSWCSATFHNNQHHQHHCNIWRTAPFCISHQIRFQPQWQLLKAHTHTRAELTLASLVGQIRTSCVFTIDFQVHAQTWTCSLYTILPGQVRAWAWTWNVNLRKAGTNLCMHQQIKPNQHEVTTDRCNRLCAVVVRCGCHVPWLYP